LKSKPILAAVLAVVCAAVFVACGGDDTTEVSQGTVVQTVTVVNTRDGSSARERAVVIDQGRIIAVVPSRSVRVAAGVQVVDGGGRYLVPGYLDLHTHALPAADATPPPWPLFIANGITGVREMAGSAALIARARQLNADRAAGTFDAPEVLQVPAEPLAGVSPANAALLVQQKKALGADFIKVVSASRDGVFAIAQEARKEGLDVAGHLSVGASAVETATAGWHAFEHLGAGFGIALDCSTQEATIRQALLGGQGAQPPFPATFTMFPTLYRAADAPFYQQVIDSFDTTRCSAAAGSIVAAGTWQVPTLIRLKTSLLGDSPVFTQDPNLRYVDPTTRALWAQLAQQYTANMPAGAAATFRDYYAVHVKVLQALRQQGAKLLAGSDQGGIWVIPGFSLHQEFAELAAAGFTPLEVLQMTTLNGARFLQREATMGTVEAGRNADLVLLEADPLADVANLSRIAGVLLRGKYFSKTALEALKEQVATAQAAQPMRALHTAIDTSHVD
jgi:hypothetical protein